MQQWQSIQYYGCAHSFLFAMSNDTDHKVDNFATDAENAYKFDNFEICNHCISCITFRFVTVVGSIDVVFFREIPSPGA